MRGDLEKLYVACRRTREKNADVPELIQHILGPALMILGTPATTDNFSPALLPEINRQVTLIRAADKMECPPWLDHSDDDPFFKIDYRRCKPVSFYAGNPALADYHRAVRWLQMVPLRASNDKELTAWALMTAKVSPLWDAPDFQCSFAGISNFVGPLDERGLVTNDPDIRSAVYGKRWGEENSLSQLRKLLLAVAPQGAKLNDISFRVMPTHTLPDAEIFLQSLNSNIRPNGLMVAAYLGSHFAHERMSKIAPAKWNEWIAHARLLEYPQDGAPRSLYVDYLDLLRTLNTSPANGAPQFMNNLPWQAKTCQTQLAGWTQMRHTFALQSKVAIFFLSGEPQGYPPGFVEPNPAFWREYVRLLERTIALLQEENIFEPSNALIADELHRQANKVESFGLHLPNATLDKLEKAETEDFLEFGENTTQALIQTNYEGPYNRSFEYKTAQEMQADYQRIIIWLRTSADKVERGELVVQNRHDRNPPLKLRWHELATLARQLETILAKQPSETELADSERTIIISFGEKLAECMGYFAHAKGMPRDDSPRWIEVAHDVLRDQSLGIATGRARALYILYPWHGRELLCTGAVLSYYEEWAPTKRLTDEEWKQKLDSPAAPSPPDWLTPILAK